MCVPEYREFPGARPPARKCLRACSPVRKWVIPSGRLPGQTWAGVPHFFSCTRPLQVVPSPPPVSIPPPQGGNRHLAHEQ